jgi:hypothetical protein
MAIVKRVVFDMAEWIVGVKWHTGRSNDSNYRRFQPDRQQNPRKRTAGVLTVNSARLPARSLSSE